VYIYTIIAFNFSDLRGAYAFEDRMECDSLWDCVKTHFGYGLTINPIWEEDLIPWAEIPFNFTYFILINLILTAIIAAIIIDAFALERLEKKEAR
jgi:hypothetical protein